jgi:hypothetical protein
LNSNGVAGRQHDFAARLLDAQGLAAAVPDRLELMDGATSAVAQAPDVKLNLESANITPGVNHGRCYPMI